MDLLTILTLIGVIVAIIGIPWYLGHRMGRLEIGYKNLTKVINGLLNLAGATIGLLHKHATLTDIELSDILKNYAEMARVPEASGTPLTEEERARLNNYLGRVHRGELFLGEEVTDYNDLVAKLEKEKKGDPSVWPLIALGAFLAGLFQASRQSISPQLEMFTLRMKCPLTKMELYMPKDCGDCVHLAERALFPATPDERGVSNKRSVYTMAKTCIYPAKVEEKRR